MKILQVITTLGFGGAEKLILEISPIMRDKGHQIDVLSFDGVETPFKSALIEAGINVYSFGENCNVYNPFFIIKLARLMKGYDIVHTHNTAAQLFAAFARICSKVKLITTEHNTYNRRRDISWLKWLDRFMYSKYQSIICISNLTRKNLVLHLPSIEQKSIVVNNGINISKYSEVTISEEAMSLRADGDIIVTMVGGFRYQKDQDTIIRSLKRLPNNFKLWLVGDGERRPHIEKLIHALEVQSRVHLWGVREDIPELLKSSDIVVMSSHWEGFGLAAAEGMAAGRPVIASNVDGLSQVVGGAGLLFEPGNDQELSSLLQYVMTDNKEYHRIVQRQNDRVRDFGIERMVEEYLKIYNTMLS